MSSFFRKSPSILQNQYSLLLWNQGKMVDQWLMKASFVEISTIDFTLLNMSIDHAPLKHMLKPLEYIQGSTWFYDSTKYDLSYHQGLILTSITQHNGVTYLTQHYIKFPEQWDYIHNWLDSNSPMMTEYIFFTSWVFILPLHQETKITFITKTKDLNSEVARPW